MKHTFKTLKLSTDRFGVVSFCKIIARCNTKNILESEVIANAQRIILCCNYHDDLLRACKKVLNNNIDLQSLKVLVDEIDHFLMEK